MARILIADDSLIARKNLRAILTQAGHTIVAEALNGKQAYIEYEQHKPDLVTLDITMPVMNGIDAVKKIIGTYPDAKIIVISAFNQRKMIFDALEGGAKFYIIKPITGDRLLPVVNDILKDSDQLGGQTGGSKHKLEENTFSEETELKPFSIKNKNGSFIISINKSIDSESFSALNTSIGEILFIKPLKVVLNFGEISTLNDLILNRLVKVINNLKRVDIKTVVVSQNKDFIQFLIDKKVDVSTSYYSDISSMEL